MGGGDIKRNVQKTRKNTYRTFGYRCVWMCVPFAWEKPQVTPKRTFPALIAILRKPVDSLMLKASQKGTDRVESLTSEAPSKGQTEESSAQSWLELLEKD